MGPDRRPRRPDGSLHLWPPRGDTAGIGRVNIERALQTGLTLRPIADTARDTLAWFESLPADRRATLRAGLSPEREAQVLRACSSNPVEGLTVY
jgi:2'-hydroxyisoflavone reductase